MPGTTTRTRKKAPAKKKAAPRKAAASKRGVSDQQKQAMQLGRQEGAAVRRYLTALRSEQAPKRRGRRRTPDQIRARIEVIDSDLKQGVEDPLAELQLRQERQVLVNDLQDREPKAPSTEFVDDFIKAVKGYSERKGVTYAVWREIGVPVDILKKAGVNGRS